ncbi:MAG: phosphoadenosine phosphosulfate reductase family protein [Cyanobacteria bacterium J06592_8]
MTKERRYITISGKDSLAMAVVQQVNHPELSYTYLFSDTGAELPETYQWLADIEEKMGWKIERVGRSIEETIRKDGALPSPLRRWCTEKMKIRPMKKFFDSGIAHVYLGIRADEKTRVFPFEKNTRQTQIIRHYPLVDAGIDQRGVWAILDGLQLLPPTFFWQQLWDAVNNRLNRGWSDTLSSTEKHLLFSGRTRSNCYFCFYQRHYEWIWLADTHPELFENAVELENLNGRGFTWIKDKPLTKLIQDRDRIFERRVQEVIEYINNRGAIFTDTEIANTSCGMMCGK